MHFGARRFYNAYLLFHVDFAESVPIYNTSFHALHIKNVQFEYANTFNNYNFVYRIYLSLQVFDPDMMPTISHS